MDRRKQLEVFLPPLDRLVAIIKGYPEFDALFKYLADRRDEAQGYLESGFTQEQLNHLSAGVHQLLTGKHFDYYPFTKRENTGELEKIPEAEEYYALLTEVAELALDLRVTGTS